MNVRALMAVSGMLSTAATGQCINPPDSVNSGDGYECNPIEVVWSDVPEALTYELYRAPVSNPGDATLIESSLFTQYFDYDAAYDTPYLYWVVTVGACGSSLNSMTVQATRISESFTAPVWVQASDSTYCDMIEVDWGISSYAPNYYIYRAPVDEFESAELVGESGSPPFQDFGMPANVAQYYWVVGVTECGRSMPSPSDIGYSLYGLYLNGGPSDTQAPVGGVAEFHVDVSGFGAFEWYHDGQIVYSDTRITGADTDTITINDVTGNDGGWYHCVIYGGCGTITSDWAFLTVTPGNSCAADLSGSSDPNDPGYGVPDGNVDSADFFYFLDQFTGGNLAKADLTGSSDPNDPAYGTPDGLIDAADFFFYLDLFVQGC
ncbi:MAG: hypothetical protein IT439_07820 [Phycisphaerales bacterium]|nr:hypothetical protein [Phycisphaerales bacterium]